MNRFFVVSLAGLLLTAAVASADNVNGQIGLNFNSRLSGNYDVNVTDDQYGGYTGWAGPYDVDLYADSGISTFNGSINQEDNRLLYCMELKQYASYSGEIYDVDALENAPVPAADVTAPIGLAKANILKHLYHEHYPGPDTTSGLTGSFAEADGHRAFQLAVWEVVHENSSSDVGDPNTYSLSDGDFTAQNVYSIDDVAAADALLSGLPTTGNRSVLLALTNDGHQDFIYNTGGTEDTAVVPSPTATVNLIALGLALGFIAIRRRRIA